MEGKVESLRNTGVVRNRTVLYRCRRGFRDAGVMVRKRTAADRVQDAKTEVPTTCGTAYCVGRAVWMTAKPKYRRPVARPTVLAVPCG